MLVSMFYFLFALLALGFLIFIHELGHYWMARRVGMRVESFGIGFGRPIYSFEHKGVKWNICWLPFGGYVKIAGMEKEGGLEPQQISDGFFGKSPWDRIKVAFMGPLANLVFAFLLFSVLWALGGREKNFIDVTNKIGWVDPNSDLYKQGIRPGDIILSYNKEPVRSGKDHFHAAMMGGEHICVEGLRFKKQTNAYEPFILNIRPYPHPQSLERGILTTGVLSPASYILYEKNVDGSENPLPKGSPLEGSGIQYGDRIVWIDGERIFSLTELTNVLNDGRVLVTVKRGNDLLLRRVPRVFVEELKLDSAQKDELIDWQWAAHLKNSKFSKLYFIPYNLDTNCVVESKLDYIDQEKEITAFPNDLFSYLQAPLLPGDEIVSVHGTDVKKSYEVLAALQTHSVQIIVQQIPEAGAVYSEGEAEKLFDGEIRSADLDRMEKSIGTPEVLRTSGSLRLLKSVVPKTRGDLFHSQGNQAQFATELEEERKQIQAIDDPQKRAEVLKFLEKREQQLLLGLPGVQDLHVQYNPSPVQTFTDVVDEIVKTFSALIGGYLSPKWLSGPIGIVQVIHHQWMLGIKEALFWIGTISLNLGLLNLLPLPVLDGGYICLSLFEICTGKRLKSKTIEKIVIPFAVLLIAFLIFLTYHDIIRIVGGLFG